MYTANLLPAEDTNAPLATSQAKLQEIQPLSKVDPGIIKLFSNSIADLADEEGWAYLGDLDSLMIKKKPDFDSRN